MKFAVKAEAELRHIRLEKDKYQSEYTRKVEHVGGDFDKLTVSLTKAKTKAKTKSKTKTKTTWKIHIWCVSAGNQPTDN